MTLFDVRGEREPIVETIMGKMIEGIGEGWTSILNQDLLYEVCKELKARSFDNEIIHPRSTTMLRAFRECKFSILKVVFVGQDPYHQPGVADGLAFSCGNTLREQPSLKFVFDEIQKTAHHYRFTRQPDLTRWANQGILMLNTALSVKEYTPDSHTHIWRPFVEDLFRKLNERTSGLIYVFFGRKAQAFSHLINGETNTKINVVHPAAAAHRGGVWDCENLFNGINNFLKQTSKEEIIW